MTFERVEEVKEGLKEEARRSPASTRFPRLRAAGVAMSSTVAFGERKAIGSVAVAGFAKIKGLAASTGPSFSLTASRIGNGAGASCSYRSLVTVKTILLVVVVCSWRRPPGAFTSDAEATVTEQVVRCPLQTSASAAARAFSSVCAWVTSPAMDTDTAVRIISVALNTEEFLSASLRADRKRFSTEVVRAEAENEASTFVAIVMRRSATKARGSAGGDGKGGGLGGGGGGNGGEGGGGDGGGA
jgi:hypothetical protein